MKKINILLVFTILILSSINISFASDTLVDKAWDIVDAVLWLGYAISLGMVVFIGIKYITGAAEAKANMKSALVAYGIGAVLVFSATTITKMVISWSGGNSSSTSNALSSTLIDSITGIEDDGDDGDDVDDSDDSDDGDGDGDQ